MIRTWRLDDGTIAVTVTRDVHLYMGQSLIEDLLSKLPMIHTLRSVLHARKNGYKQGYAKIRNIYYELNGRYGR